MNSFVVVTADVIDSRRHPDFAALLQPKLQSFKTAAMLTPFSLSRGDEIQALIQNGNELPIIVRHLRYRCFPLKVRIGIGIGAIESEIFSDNSWDMNGEAFFRARHAVQQLKQSKNPGTIIHTENKSFDLPLNTIWMLIDYIMERWTPEQWEAIHLYEKHSTFQKAAEVLNIARQNVQKRCQAAAWDKIKTAETNLAVLMKSQFYDNSDE